MSGPTPDEGYFCPACAAQPVLAMRENRLDVALPETPTYSSMKVIERAGPRDVGPASERAGGAVTIIVCPMCGWSEIISDEFFTPPRDGFDPPGETEA